MKFEAKKQQLVNELALIQAVCEKKSSDVVATRVLLDATSATDAVRLVGTDADVSLDTRATATVRSRGAVVLNASKFTEVIRALPDGPTVVVASEKDNWVTVTCGGSRFRIAGAARDSFPTAAAEGDGARTPVEIPGSVFATMVKRTAFAITREESRYTLQGAQLEIEGGTVRMIATDGHRLAFIERVPQPPPPAASASVRSSAPASHARTKAAPAAREAAAPKPIAKAGKSGAPSKGAKTAKGAPTKPVPAARPAAKATKSTKGKEPAGLSLEAIIPRKALAALAKILENTSLPVHLSQADNHLFFKVGDRLLTARKLGGKFPEYRKVMKDAAHSVTVDAQRFRRALGRVALMADGRSHAVKFDFTKESVALSSNDTTAGEAHETVQAEYAGPESSVSLNATYVDDFLAAVGGSKVAVGLPDSTMHPVLLTPTEKSAFSYTCYLMPLRT